MSALICGSFAYDTIMVYSGQFKNEILPEKVHMLNVSFLVPELRREFGGCAGNIAYNLKLLGGQGAPMGTVGDDFAPYQEWMDKNGVSREFVKPVPGSYTAQAYITTDLDDNQITAFHPGAMNEAHQQKIPASGITLGMVSPDGRQGMIDHAAQFAELGIPFFFDPGQGLPMFGGDDLQTFIAQATYITVNDYESAMLQDKTGMTLEHIASQVDALIVTRGGEGSSIYVDGDKLDIPAVAPQEIKDPTGCGDAYRAGLIYGVQNGLDWTLTAGIASLMGSIKIEQNGTQNHRFTRDEFMDRFEQAYGTRF